MNKRFPGKVTELLAVDKDLWDQLSDIRNPYGNINEMFEDIIRIFLGQMPKKPEMFRRLNESVTILKIKEKENENVNRN